MSNLYKWLSIGFESLKQRDAHDKPTYWSIERSTLCVYKRIIDTVCLRIKTFLKPYIQIIILIKVG